LQRNLNIKVLSSFHVRDYKNRRTVNIYVAINERTNKRDLSIVLNCTIVSYRLHSKQPIDSKSIPRTI